MGLFGKKETEWGYRFGGKDVWIGSKKDAEDAIRRMKKAVKAGGTVPKLIQRTRRLTAIRGNVKSTCSGGKCNRRGNVCRKHFREMSGGKGSEWSLKDIHKRWDEEGHRWG